ncbi:MAG TPA: formate dehydrogenase accessory sulfurtransferase FdhD [Tepidisphaeraceae bacterium]|jgi:FdhD protein|nr:formate dehydrogenase accessory sulfurtransferase FdhD [Tepidisphaeraceae bacterium]
MPNIFNIHRYEAGGVPSSAPDELAIEEPLEIRVKNRAVSVTMRTPGNDEELAAGFLLSEGIIRRRDDLLRIEPCPHDRIGNVVNAILSPTTPVDFDRLTRHVFASSSCGLCGKATIESVCQRVEPIESEATVDANVLLKFPDRLRQVQATFNRTGGLHGAAIFDAQGQLIVAREDVGRHNAVDKVLGFGLMNNLLPFDRHILMVSGRLSFEIMQKSLAGRIPIVAAVSAPSTLAVEFAKESGQTLAGFIRGRRMNIYAGLQRVRFA